MQIQCYGDDNSAVLDGAGQLLAKAPVAYVRDQYLTYTSTFILTRPQTFQTQPDYPSPETISHPLISIAHAPCKRPLRGLKGSNSDTLPTLTFSDARQRKPIVY